eukprot:351465-Chlamydomonas_euryale.AAC.12
MLVGAGGNAGNQSAIKVIRALVRFKTEGGGKGMHTAACAWEWRQPERHQGHPTCSTGSLCCCWGQYGIDCALASALHTRCTAVDGAGSASGPGAAAGKPSAAHSIYASMGDMHYHS